MPCRTAQTRRAVTQASVLGVAVLGPRESISPGRALRFSTHISVRENLDYIQDAGFTAGTSTLSLPSRCFISAPFTVWISPVSQNYNGPTTPYGDPYHGYWIADATMLNDRFGTSDDLKSLSRELHNRGMSVTSLCFGTAHCMVMFKVPHGRHRRQRRHGYLDQPRLVYLHVQGRGQKHTRSSSTHPHLHVCIVTIPSILSYGPEQRHKRRTLLARRYNRSSARYKHRRCHRSFRTPGLDPVPCT